MREPQWEHSPFDDVELSINWDSLPVVHVPIDSLVPCQDTVSLHKLAALVNGGTPENGPRVISYRGGLYLQNGHTQWVLAYLRGSRTFAVRIGSAPVGMVV